MVSTGMVFPPLVCYDVAYELCGFVMIQDPFDLGDQFWGNDIFVLPKDFVQFSSRGRAVSGQGTHYGRETQSVQCCEEQ